jgi:PAS domain-containing protein
MFESLAIPVFVFDRTGSIRYVNPAFKALTGFNLPCPTSVSEIYVYIFSPNGLKAYIDAMFNFMENFEAMLPSTGFMFSGGVRVFDPNNGPEKSLEGDLIVNSYSQTELL